jgi:putative endonuclease
MADCYLYILESEKNGRYYIGVSEDLNDRLNRHNQGRSLATKAYRPWMLIYSERFDDRRSALARERQLKAWKNRERIGQLIGRSKSS